MTLMTPLCPNGHLSLESVRDIIYMMYNNEWNLFGQLLPTCMHLKNKWQFFVASFGGNVQAAQILIEAGANINRKDKDGKTPLMVKY